MAEQKKYEAITDEEHSDVEQFLIKSINKHIPREEISENYYKYVLTKSKNKKYIAAMTVDEVAELAKLIVDLLEELKNINNNGINRAEFENIKREIDSDFDAGNILQILDLWVHIRTERLNELIAKLDRVRLVGGAWALLVSNPCFINAIYLVYDKIVDSFDNETLYVQAAYYLLEEAMGMNTNELTEDDNEGEIGNREKSTVCCYATADGE